MRQDFYLEKYMRYGLTPARLARACVAAIALSVLGGGALAAEPYPAGPVRVIVSLPASGVADTLARIMAQRLSETWAQPVVVEPRPGGNQIIGVQLVTKARPDGYTLLVAADAAVVTNPHFYDKLPYDPVKDLTPLIVLGQLTPMLAVNPALPVSNVRELVALAKSQPGVLNYGSFGKGTFSHLSTEDFKSRTGTNIVEIPYAGGAPAVTALVSGQVSMLLVNYSSIQAHEKAGKVRIIGAAGPKRAVMRPELATVAESGVPGFATGAWFGLFGPANMPPALVAKLHADVSKGLDSPQTRQFFEQNSFERVERSPQEFAHLIQDDLKHWGGLIKMLGVKLDQ